MASSDMSKSGAGIPVSGSAYGGAIILNGVGGGSGIGGVFLVVIGFSVMNDTRRSALLQWILIRMKKTSSATVARVQRAICRSTLMGDLIDDGCDPVFTTVFFMTRETIDREDAITTRIAANQGRSQRDVHCFRTKAPRIVRAMIEARATTSKTNPATVIPFQKGKSLTFAAATSTTKRTVEAERNVKVTKLAPQMIGREEEVRRPIGAIVATEDQSVDEEFQKVVLRDKEVGLVVAGVAR